MSLETVLSEVAVTGTPYSADAAEPSLHAYLQSLLHDDLPPPLPDSGPVVLIRRWPPRGSYDATAIDFVDHHPEFWPGRPGIPTRHIMRLSRVAKKGWRGLFQSRKMRRPVRHHTGVELGVLKACEVDGAVTAFVEHPTRIRVRVNSKERTLLLSTYIERSEEK